MIAEYAIIERFGEWGAFIRNVIEPVEKGHQVKLPCPAGGDATEKVRDIVWGNGHDFLVRLENARQIQVTPEVAPFKAHWGSPVDGIFRVWVRSLSAKRGDPVVVESKSGAETRGVITDIVKRSPRKGVSEARISREGDAAEDDKPPGPAREESVAEYQDSARSKPASKIWVVKPHKLPDRQWGAVSERKVAVGQIVQVCTRKGESWNAKVTRLVEKRPYGWLFCYARLDGKDRKRPRRRKRNR